MNFGEIKAKVRDYLVDLPAETSALVADWVNHALRVAQDRHNFRAMEAQADYVTVAGARKLADKPADWKEFRVLPWLEGPQGDTREIQWASSITDMMQGFGVSATHDVGAPRALLETPTEIHVYPLPSGTSLWPDGEFRISVPYWRYFPSMTGAADESFFTGALGWFLVFHATAEGMVFNREEERAAVFIGKAEQEFGRCVSMDRKSRIGERQTFSIKRTFPIRSRAVIR